MSDINVPFNGRPVQKIVLTDYINKEKHIEAYYKGMDTEQLQEKRRMMFHLMMEYMCDSIGGYVVEFDRQGIELELYNRGVELEVL